jgi:predicted ATPase
MADGITRIAVEGFKSIATRQEIEIAPLTILAGANSSGKSSIMQPLLMLKQTLEATTDPGPLWIGGPNVKFTSAEQFFSRAGGRQLTIGFGTSSTNFEIVFARGQKVAAEVLKETLTRNGTLTLRPEMSSDEIRREIGGMFSKDELEDTTLSIVPNRCFLDVKHDGFVTSNFKIMELVAPHIQSLIHVPGLRGNPDRTYPVRSTGAAYPGTFQDYAASLIYRWQAEDPDKQSSLNRDLEHIGLAEQVLARNLNDVQIELRVNRVTGTATRDLVSVCDVGFGVAQALPVLVALRVADERQLVYIEEPEIHLHPRAQVRLADVLAAAAKRGVRVVAETHSSLLLRAIQTLVAKGELPGDMVRLHWFSRDADGVTHVASVTPDENGAFGDWPEDFGDVALQSEKDYLDAVETKLAR